MKRVNERIKQAREKAGYSYSDLSKLTGIPKTSLQRYETGTTLKIPLSAISKLEQALNLPRGFLLGWSEMMPDNILPITKVAIPFLGEISCGEPVFASEDRQSYVASGINVKADFCLKAKGDSMINARIYDGDIVFIQKCDMVENGTIAAVVIGDDALLKRVFFYPEQGKLLLVAENTKYPPLVYEGEDLNTVKILGKAVAFQSDVR